MCGERGPRTLSSLALIALACAPRAAFAQAPSGAAARPSTEERPWRAHEALGVRWLRFGLEQRFRFEHLTADVRTTNPATAFSSRTLASLEIRALPLLFGAELQDARAWTSFTTPVNANLINHLELIQAYVGARRESVFARGDAVALNAGRMTIDLGSRRLVARNEFRNTINSFTGVDLQWTSPARDLLRVFAVMPVVRLPFDAEGLLEGTVTFDAENLFALLWAAYFQSRPLVSQITVEAYVIGLHESDTTLAPSPNRQLVTPGVRVLRPPAPGRFDFQLELMGQFGRSRASAAATDTRDLAHAAFSVHASAAYRFNVRWAPRLVLQYDYATGDRRPGDGENNRFDPLFGARRFEFGPTGIFGALARSNVSTLGLRFEAQPHRRVDAFAAYRAAWLASTRDAWTSAELTNPNGGAGDFIGHQVEARVRWHVFPRNLSFDLGAAVILPGEFPRGTPGGLQEPAAYFYSQVTGTI